MAGLRRFETLIAAQDRLYLGVDGRIYAFANLILARFARQWVRSVDRLRDAAVDCGKRVGRFAMLNRRWDTDETLKPLG
jgi:hypothetical protein